MSSLNIIPKKVAVVIPCYNEAASIAGVIDKLPRKQFADLKLELRIYVIDNNSTDDTANVAKKAGATVLREPKKGKGNAMRTGFRNLPDDVDYVVMIDGDDTYSSDEILRLIEPLRSNFCDVVLGSRLGGRIQPAAMSWLNFCGNKIFTLAVRLLYGANVTDVLTGYFAWRKPALDALAPHIKSAGFAIEMEMITRMARLGQHMTSVPISYHPRSGKSHLRPFTDGLRILAVLLANLMWRPWRKTVAAYKGPTTVKKQPRKIVFVSDAIYPYMKGGKEKRLYEITKRLAAMGNDVHIYTMHWWDSPVKTRVENGVRLHAICKYHDMYHGDRRSISEGILFGLACFKLLRVQFDVIDVDHMPFFPVFSTWIICKLTGRKMHATWHEALSHREWITYMGVAGLIGSLIERMSIQLPHRITTISEQTRQLIGSIHGRIKRVELVTCGIDVPLINSIQPANITCDVLYFGRLVKDKNVSRLILAVGIVAQTNPHVQCLIIGKGNEKPNLQKLVAHYKLQNNVHFLDPLPEATDVYAYMKAAKVFCTPSVREGFGIATLEALGCGTPVITIDSPSNAGRHLVQDGQNGSVVPLVPTAIAAAILRWMAAGKNPDIAANVADCDWRNIAEKQAEVYQL